MLRDGMPLNDASDSSGAFNFGVDTLADVERIEVIRGPMAALYGSGAIGGVINLISRQGHEPGLHVTGDLAGGYPAADRGQRQCLRHRGSVRLFADPAGSRSQRGFDATPQRMSIYTGVPEGFRDADRHAQSRLHAGRRHARVAVLRARRATFGFNTLGNPTFDNANSTGNDESLLGRIGVSSKLFDGTYETNAYLGRLQDDRHYTEALNPLDPNQAEDNSRYHGYRTDVQWNNTVHLSTTCGRRRRCPPPISPSATSTSPTTANVKVNQSSGGFPFTQNAKASMTDDALYAGLQTTLWQRADADRTDPPGLGRRQLALHVAARRGARRAGGR